MKPGYCTEVKYVRTVDADTIEVEFKRRFHIRLQDIDAPEKSTDIGKEAMFFVHNLLSKAHKVLINIDLGDTLKLMDINSFNRIVASIEVDGKSLKQILIDNGYEK